MSVVDNLKSFLAKLPLEDLHRRELAVIAREAELASKEFEAQIRDLRVKLEVCETAQVQAQKDASVKDQVIKQKDRVIHDQDQAIKDLKARLHRFEGPPLLDEVEVRLLVFMARSGLDYRMLASAAGTAEDVAKHRIGKLIRAGLVEHQQVGDYLSMYEITDAGRDWLHRNGHLG